MSLDLDAIEDRHIACATKPKPQDGMQALSEYMNALRDSAADVSDLIAEVRRLLPIERKYERLMETHAMVKGASLG